MSTAPIDGDATINAVDENAATNTVVGVTVFASDADAGNNTITYTLDDTADGRFKIDSVSGVVTVDNGTLLDREAAASHSITVRATSSDGSFDTAVMTINVNDVDEFDVTTPIDSDATINAVDENAATNTVVGVTAFASDADNSNNTITYTLDDTAGGRFKIDAVSGVVTVDNGTLLDREAAASHNITVRATSSDGSFDTAVMTINVNDVDEFDVTSPIDSDATINAVDENAATNTVVGVTVFASDADASNNTITYTLDDTAGGRFKIDSVSGVVTVDNGTLLDREAAASHNITVRATSSDGSFDTAVMTINVNDVDEFDVTTPIDSDATINAVDENAANNTVVGVTAFASDADATNSAITYTLDDTAGGRFKIDSVSGVVTVDNGTLLDREAAASHNIMVRATSSDGSFDTAVMTINVNDVDEFDVTAPIDGDATINAVDENAATNTVVGVTVFASDADATNSAITYALDDNAGGRFKIDSVSGVVTVDNGALLDREAAASHNILVRATSSDGSFDTRLMTINVLDIDEFDVGPITDIDGTINAVEENAIIGTIVGITADAGDADATNSAITYSLQDNDGGRFQIDSSTGVVTVAGAIDREADGSTRSITVRVTSTDGSSTDQVFAINISDADEFDVGSVMDADVFTNAVDENATIGTTVGITAAAGDLDATNNFISYSLQDSDGGRFAINATTGVVTVAGGIDREADGPSRMITVRATSADGSFTDQVFAVSINDRDESDVGAVTDNDLTANGVNENATVGTIVGVTVSASDADATTNAITYSLQDNDGGRFSIDSGTGVVSVAGAIDREADGPARNITVRATSADSSFSDQVFTINIHDIDEFDVGSIADTDVSANTVNENASIGTLVGLQALASDADATTNSITYSLIDSAGGRFAIDAGSGVVIVAGSLDFEAGASHNITVQASSSDGSVSTQSLIISVLDVNEAPVAVDDRYSAFAGTALTLSGPSPLGNDRDQDGDALLISVVAPPSNGTLTVDGLGNLVYTPDPGFLGRDTISYRTNDGSLTSNLAVIEINVFAGSGGGGDADPGPDSDPNPDPDPDPVDDGDENQDDDDDRERESDSLASSSITSASGEAVRAATFVSSEVNDSDGIEAVTEGPQRALLEYYFGQPRLLDSSLDRSLELAMLDRLLQLDLEQAIVWHQWERNQHQEDSTSSFYVGTAGIAAGMFSVGYVFWALRGGAFVAAITSTLPSWRLVDPATLLSAYRASRSVANDRIEQMMG